MGKVFGVIGSIMGVLVLLVFLFCLAFGAEWLGIKWKGYFGPKHQDVERTIFRETQSFNRGAETQLADYRLQYMREKDPVVKSAILTTVRSQFADVDPSNISNPDIRSFLQSAITGVEPQRIGMYQDKTLPANAGGE